MDLLYTLRDLKLLYVSNVQMDLCDYCYKTNRRCTNLAAMRGKIVLMGIICGRKGRPLYGIEGWPLSGGFLCTVLRAMRSGPRSVSAIERVVAY